MKSATSDTNPHFVMVMKAIMAAIKLPESEAKDALLRELTATLTALNSPPLGLTLGPRVAAE